MEFNYYYGSQADQFSFIRIPKVMLTEELFSDLSIPAKVLYGAVGRTGEIRVAGEETTGAWSSEHTLCEELYDRI